MLNYIPFFRKPLAAVNAKDQAGFVGHRPVTRQKRNTDAAFHTCADMESTKMADDDIPQPMLSEMNEAVNQPSHIPSSLFCLL